MRVWRQICVYTEGEKERERERERERDRERGERMYEAFGDPS